MTRTAIPHPKVVSRSEWLAARKQFLSKEKEFTRLRDQLSAGRRALPWVKVDREYVFDAPAAGNRCPTCSRAEAS